MWTAPWLLFFLSGRRAKTKHVDRTGEDIVVAGYPLHGLLSSGLTVTKGIVSSTRGPRDNQDIIQITAPVQLGNSGGPVLDSSGHVIGVVFSKLNALKFARITGSIPQNINFAVSAGSTRAFLDGYSVPYDTAPSDRIVHTADIAEKAQDYTVGDGRSGREGRRFRPAISTETASEAARADLSGPEILSEG